MYVMTNCKVCYNVPSVSPDKTSVTVGYPVPEKKCENKPVKLPKVKCDEVTVRKAKAIQCLIKTFPGGKMLPASFCI